MIKKLARHILKKELKDKDIIIERQDDIINSLVKEVDDRDVRQYVFDIERLSPEDQKILGKFHDHEVIEVLKKAFKAKADENCDKLVHFQSEDEAKRLQWSLAVRVYDDFVLQLKTLSRLK